MKKLLGPELHELVNKDWETRETWDQYLKERHTLMGEAPGIQWYCTSNHHHIVYRGRVLTTFGYHGRNVFNDLQDSKRRKALFRSIRRVHSIVWLAKNGK